MKFLVLLAAIGCASAASSNAVTCDECQAGAAGLVDHLLSEASLAEQGEILKAIVCPQLEDADACMAAIDAYFGDMASCIYNHFVLEGDVCSRLGLCKKASIFTHVTGLVKNVPMFSPELLPTCLRMRPLPRVLSISRESASVARMDTLLTAPTSLLMFFLSPCQSLLEFWLIKLLNFAKKLLVSVKHFC
eukprot:TRINITY_DN17_c0_g1_i4.p1 TRINITY_DN17_c0_g1~~TRINITY_DN17_c0_g1_i4.p1  ORF type:complete len:219 (-),score=77.20 TRINITY_DN17_c0_g1_i4:36-605(-)